MSDIRNYLIGEANKIEGYLAKNADGRSRAEHDLKAIRALYDAFGTDRAQLLPADVRSAGQELGLHVGSLFIAPPQIASAAEVRRYVGVMRALVDQANHQAVLGVQLADRLDPEGAHVRQQATTVTMQLPAGVRAVDIQQSACRHCQAEIYRGGEGMAWLHSTGGEALCGEDQYAEPACACTQEAANWWCQVEGHKASAYPIEPAVAIPGATSAQVTRDDTSQQDGGADA